MALQGWCSGEHPFKIELRDGSGGELGAPIDATIVVQLVPLGMMMLGMGLAMTDDTRIPEPRTVSLTWAARLPKLTLHPDPLADVGMKALAKFAEFASERYAGACLQSTQPRADSPPG
jgi:hypothetical protein